MKNILFVLMATTFFFACNQSTTTVDTEIPDSYFSGKITNPKGDKLLISSGEWSKTISLNQNGEFNDTLQLNEGYYQIRHAREYGTVYFKPGNNLNLSADLQNFDETLTFTGDGAADNNYLIKKSMRKSEIIPNSRELFSMKEAEFAEKLNEIKASKIEFLKEAKEATPGFVEHEEQNIEFEFLNYLNNYKPAHAYYTKNEDFEIPAAFSEILDGVDFANESYSTEH